MDHSECNTFQAHQHLKKKNMQPNDLFINVTVSQHKGQLFEELHCQTLPPECMITWR